MMPTVAYVAERLGVPGNKFETVMSYCNKNMFRSLCDKAGVPCPKHIAVNSTVFNAEKFKSPLPWIVKPADSQSSIGIKKIESVEELKPALEEALSKSPTHTAIIEEFFKGKELVCEGFINKGKFYLLAFGDRRYFDLKDVMIPSQTLFPSTIRQDIQDKILGYEQALAQMTKPAFAIVHSEYLVNETTGEIRIVESALRGGGVYISSDLIPMATGIDINEVLLEKALGHEANVDAVFRNRKSMASAYVCFYLPEGTVFSVEGTKELETIPFVAKTFLDDIVVGTETKKPNYKGARKGPILVAGRNRAELEKNILKVQNTLKIEVIHLSGKRLGINW